MQDPRKQVAPPFPPTSGMHLMSEQLFCNLTMPVVIINQPTAGDHHRQYDHHQHNHHYHHHHALQSNLI